MPMKSFIASCTVCCQSPGGPASSRACNPYLSLAAMSVIALPGLFLAARLPARVAATSPWRQHAPPLAGPAAQEG